MSRNSGRTGLPLMNAFAPKKLCVDSNATAAARTNRASNRFVNPVAAVTEVGGAASQRRGPLRLGP